MADTYFFTPFTSTVCLCPRFSAACGEHGAAGIKRALFWGGTDEIQMVILIILVVGGL